MSVTINCFFLSFSLCQLTDELDKSQGVFTVDYKVRSYLCSIFLFISMNPCLILLDCHIMFSRGPTTELSFSLETTGISLSLEPAPCSELTIFRCEMNYLSLLLRFTILSVSLCTEMFSFVSIR